MTFNPNKSSFYTRAIRISMSNEEHSEGWLFVYPQEGPSGHVRLSFHCDGSEEAAFEAMVAPEALNALANFYG